MEIPALSWSAEKSLSPGKSRSTIKASGVGGLSRIVHRIRMFTRYISHRTGRRSHACSPSPKEGTSSPESKSC